MVWGCAREGKGVKCNMIIKIMVWGYDKIMGCAWRSNLRKQKFIDAETFFALLTLFVHALFDDNSRRNRKTLLWIIIWWKFGQIYNIHHLNWYFNYWHHQAFILIYDLHKASLLWAYDHAATFRHFPIFCGWLYECLSTNYFYNAHHTKILKSFLRTSIHFILCRPFSLPTDGHLA